MKIKSKSLAFICLLWVIATQSVFSTERLNEFECLHLNIGLLSLLETENSFFKREQKLAYNKDGPIGKALTMLKNRGRDCKLKKALYVEAAEYSLHFRQLRNTEYFLQRALQAPIQ